MKIHDLSYNLNEDTWYYGAPYTPFRSKKIATMEKNGYIAREFNMNSHFGTHIECAAHWDDDGASVTDFPMETFIGDAKVFKFGPVKDDYFAIDREMLIKAGGEDLKSGDILILSTGWDEVIKEQKYVTKSPFLTIDGAEYLASKKVKLVAFDFPMCGDPRDGVDSVPEGTELPDTILFDAGIPVVVGMVSTVSLPKSVHFVALPLKIEGADGTPVRAVAIEK